MNRLEMIAALRECEDRIRDVRRGLEEAERRELALRVEREGPRAVLKA